MMFVSKKHKQIIGHVLIVIFSLYYANICFFYHSHIINGVTIVHSHMHHKSHAQTATHSSSELTLISILSAFQTLQASLGFAGLGIFLLLQAVVRPFFEKRVIPCTVVHASPRAPPCRYAAG
jgi:hypothetical protein